MTDEIKSNTYSCKTGSLCNSGQPLPSKVLTPPVHTHQVTMEAIDQHRMREKVREMKPSINNGKIQEESIMD